MRQNDTRGSMPFAVVAVTILLVSVIAAGAAVGFARSEDNADGTGDDIDSIDEALEDITTFVNRGLGELIYRISTEETSKGLEERAEDFKTGGSEWIGYMFPVTYGGVVAECKGFELELVTESMAVPSDTGMDGCAPAYLRGKGSIDVILTSQSGRADTSVEVSTDGSYALPLAVSRGSMFEAMAGTGVSLSQMMTYQLTSLAEYRIMNGYGGKSSYGSRSTDAILTGADVEKAFAICMDAISALCFRNPEDMLSPKTHADLADILVSADGRVLIDISAVYAQAMLSAVDDIALKWLDYFYGYDVLEAVYDILNPLKDALSSLSSFLKGEDRVSGAPYVRKVMESNGIPESAYSYPGSGTTHLTLGGYSISFSNPTFDILSQPWMTNFKLRYEQDGDFVKDYLLDVLRKAAISMALRMDLGTVAVSIDPFDEEGFLEKLTSEFSKVMTAGGGAMESVISSSLDDSTVYDEFYGKLADEISAHAEELVDSSGFMTSMRAALAEAIAADRARAEEEGIEFVEPDIDALLSSSVASEAVQSYRSSVYSDLEVFEPLKQVTGGDGSIIKKGLTWICSYGLQALDILVPVEERSMLMVSEILAMNDMNPYGGVTGMPGTGCFELKDDTGNVMREYLSSEVTLGSPVAHVRIDESECIHTVGFREDLSAAYSTAWTVDLSGTVVYEVTGRSTLAQALGSVTSSYSGSFPVDLTLEIVAASGWALSGVDYRPSVTVIDDLKAVLLECLEPLIEPLRKMMRLVRDAIQPLSEAVMELYSFVSENLIRLYNAIMDPLEELREMTEGVVEDAINETVLGVLVDINMGTQSVELDFFGCRLTLTTAAITWTAKTKTVLTAELVMPIAGLTVTAGMTAKIKGDVKAENLLFTFFGGIEGDGWEVDAKVDPLMKSSKYLVSMSGKVGKSSISLVAPKLDNYYEMGLALSDVPGIGEAIDNIPVPLLGVNVGLDAGFSIRYSTATVPGLLINEVELNPEGTDSGNEWIELHNNSLESVDLDGYSLSATSDRKKKTMELSGTMSPGEFLLINPDFTLVNSGEGIELRDADGEVVDKVSKRKDSSNDGKTWQRKFDGSTEWVFADGSPEKSNSSPIGAVITGAEMKECVWSAVQKAFGKVPNITDVDTLVSYVQYLVRYTIEEVIDVVSGQLIDASVYVSADVKDMTSSVTGGIRVAFRTDGDLVKDCLRYVAGQLESLLLGMKNPYRIDPLEMFAENIDLEVSFHAGVGFPELLSKGTDLPEMDLCVVFRANMSSLTRIVGSDTGDPEMVFGIMARDCPKEVIPSKLGAKDGMEHDLWLFVVSITLR